MFTIMDNRKRARFEVVNTQTQPTNDCLQGVANSVNSLGSATLATIGGQSFILSNTGATSLPANILLSICDDNSDESEEYIIDSSVLQQIKQENSVATQTAPSSNTQPAATAQLLTTIPQYRIINQSGKPLNNNTSLASNPSSTIISSPVTSNSTLIPTSMQLSSGCEIYVIKEVIEPPKQLMAEPSMPHKTLLNNNTTIKLEPISPTPAPAAGTIQIIRSSTATSANKVQNQPQQQQQQQQQPKQTAVTSNICQNTMPNVISSTLNSNQEDSNRRSLILEAYKKRDDKRRATHNEVERRRRDKINSWIFKLKEMLPTDVNINGGNTSSMLTTNAKDTAIVLTTTNTAMPAITTATTTSTATTRLLVQQGTATAAASTRTPPSDSKSQILIKACEYIKSMQEEIQSLRECLTENDNLRLSNQRLQEELNNLRNKQQQQQQQQHQRHHLTLNNNTNSICNNNNNNNSNNNNTNTLLLSSSQSDDDECELTLNSLNATYANVQLFSPGNTTNNHHHLSAVLGGTTTTATTSNSGITYTKRELIIRDYVD